MLASLDMLELYRPFVALVYLIHWMPFEMSNPKKVHLVLRPYYLDTGMWWYTRHDSPALGVPISEDEWLDTFAREAVLLVDLQNAAYNIQDALPEQLFYYHVVRDCYQEKEELLRGFKVAELLPLLLRDGPYAYVIITCLHQSQKRRKMASGMDNADKASHVITSCCQTNFSCEILANFFFG